jgi:YD repeat-containing protein
LFSASPAFVHAQSLVIFLVVIHFFSLGVLGAATAETFAYDQSGRFTAITHPNGQVFFYRYDKAGNLLEVDTDLIPPVSISAPVERRAGMEASIDIAGGNPMGAHQYFAQGLPAGAIIDATTGKISGRLGAAPGTYTINYWSTAGRNRSETKQVTLVISGFPAQMAGSYELLLDDETTEYPAAKLELTVDSKGAYSARLLDADGGSAASKGLVGLGAEAQSPGYAKFAIPALAGQPPANLEFWLSPTGQLTAALNSGVRRAASGQTAAKVATYSTTSPAPWRGTYTVAFDPVAWTGGTPAGTGYASVTIDNAGVARFSGKLADGTAFTSSVRPRTDGKYAVFLQPYGKAKALFAGMMSFAAPLGQNATPIFWQKPAQPKALYYPAGFDPVELEPVMQRWTPTTNVPTSLGLQFGTNFGAIFWGGGVDSTGTVIQTSGCATLPSDARESAPLIGARGGIAVGNNLRATKQTNETNHAGNPGGASVWWRWTAPANGSVTVETAGSTFDTLLAVYTNGANGTMLPIASNDDSSGTNTSGLTISAISNVTYHIAVDGKRTVDAGKTNVARGNIRLAVQTPLPATRINSFGVPAVVKFGSPARILAGENASAPISGSVNPATGIFSGSFQITDIAITNWQPRAVVKTVKFEGVLFQTNTGDIGSGFFLLPATVGGVEATAGQAVFQRNLPRPAYPAP